MPFRQSHYDTKTTFDSGVPVRRPARLLRMELPKVPVSLTTRMSEYSLRDNRFGVRDVCPRGLG
jgi:hypothetical protein